MSEQAWIVDVDGTVALKGGRGPFDWALVGEDEPNAPVIAVVRALMRDGYAIVYLSGRMEQCREATALWLGRNVDPFAFRAPLFMRPDDDYRPDEILKKEIYKAEIRDRYDVLGVLDDRAKVVRMWRDELGLTVLQCADGNF